MTDVRELHEEWMKDPEYRSAYEASQPQYELISALIGARVHAGIDQDELAERMGIHVSAIARLEGWRSNPSVNTLRRVAQATGTRLKISFVPEEQTAQPATDVPQTKVQHKELAT